ncbi:MAG TPA: hypothetical protein VEV15_12725, partial [Flavisolibacter sp.]|nr:hypothetical protein [Flavisolibacter sp.]
MRKFAVLLPLILCICSFAQTRTDTTALLQQTASLYDLDFTQAEADSMVGNIFNWKTIYQKMHQDVPKNDLAYPFAFNPAPIGFKVPVNQQKIVWSIPANVSLPSNKNDLAFYSILQLASLVKNKKISSVDLTRFFINRLKQWGDTLESVI